MNCQEVREHLPGLIDGELSPEETAAVEKHLELCEECKAEKHRQEQFTTRVKTSLEDLRPSELFVKGVLDKLSDPAARKKEEEAAARRTKKSLLAAGAVILFVLIAAWIHSALTGSGREATAATVVGYDEAWLIADDGGGDLKRDLPLEIPSESRIRTGAGGKVIMQLSAGGELTLHEKSTVTLSGSGEYGVTRIEAGGAILVSGSAPGIFTAGGVGVVSVQVRPDSQVQVSLQYGNTLVVAVKKGSAEIVSGVERVKWAGKVEVPAGETWKVPADASAKPEKVE